MDDKYESYTPTHDVNVEMSFFMFQAFIKRCYELVNNRNYSSNLVLAARIQRYAMAAEKAARLGRSERIGPNLAMCMAWAIALANRLELTLDSRDGGEIWAHYPGLCPYCGTRPCSCAERRRKRVTTGPRFKITLKPGNLNSIRSFQEMFQGIYPENTQSESRTHLLEEVIELLLAILDHDSTHGQKTLDNIFEELVDVIAHSFALATTSEIDLATEIVRLFEGDTCNRCQQPVCQCGYTQADAMKSPSSH
jgi:NTP pyrophosphatase (non-canonical NTP hydrolase)